jgi:hypothetical protein
LGLPIFLLPSGLLSNTFLTVLRFSIRTVTCRRVAGQRLGKHIPATKNTQAKIGYLPLLCNGAVNTKIEEEVFSIWFAYIHFWATEVYSIGPPRDYISRKSEEWLRTRMRMEQVLVICEVGRLAIGL